MKLADAEAISFTNKKRANQVAKFSYLHIWAGYWN